MRFLIEKKGPCRLLRELGLPGWADLMINAVLLVLLGVTLCFLLLVINAAWSIFGYEFLDDTNDLRKRVDRMAGEYVRGRPHAAMVVGVCQRGTWYIAGAGRLGPDEKEVPDGRTLYEIGSISKVFTAMAMVGVEQDGGLDFDEKLSEIFHEISGASCAPWGEITLLDLALHRSGLSRLPPHFEENLADENDPYEEYDEARLVSDLMLAPIREEKRHEYSNFGYAVLGHALVTKTGVPYNSLINKYITGPLCMDSTLLDFELHSGARIADGYDSEGNPAQHWKFKAFASAGGYISNADDLMAFIVANMGDSNVYFGRIAHTARRDAGDRRSIAWRIGKGTLHQTLYFHNGGTGGFSSFIGFDPERQLGVVVLSNYGRDSFKNILWSDPVDALGMRILKLASKITLHVE